MFRLRTAALLAGAAVALAAMGAVLAACPTTTTTTAYTPITGILIRSSSLVAGLGCGTAPGQVYRYAAVVTNSQPPVSGVFDCFADGLFENLPDNDGGAPYDLTIYAWNQAGFPPQLTCGYVDASCPGDNPTTVTGLANVGAPPQWQTTCTATPQQGITVLAVCGPLVSDAGPVDAGPAEVTIDTKDGFPVFGGDGGTVHCGPDYDMVNAFYTDNIHMPTMTGMMPCGGNLVIDPAVAGATYVIQLYLLKNQAAVWRTDCAAKAAPNANTTATCDPVLPAMSLPDAGGDGGDAATDASDGGATDALSDAADGSVD